MGDITFLFGWAKENNVLIPKKPNGETDIVSLFELYNRDKYIESLEKKSAKDISQEQKIDIKTMIIKKSNKDLLDFVNSVKQGTPTARRIVVSTVGDRERKAIENLTGEKLNAKVNTLSESEVRHIVNRHGEKGKADKSMSTTEDFLIIENVLNNFSSVSFCRDSNGEIERTYAYKDKNGEFAKLIKFSKVINGNICYVVEAVTDGKTGDLKIMSAYKTKKK